MMRYLALHVLAWDPFTTYPIRILGDLMRRLLTLHEQPAGEVRKERNQCWLAVDETARKVWFRLPQIALD